MSEGLRDSVVDHLNEALELMQEGKYKEALEKLEKAEEIARQAEADDIFLYIQTIKGYLMQNLGDYEEAFKIHTLSLKASEELISKDSGDELVQSIFQINLDAIGTLGNIFYEMGRFLQAKNCYEAHLSIYEKLLKNDPDNLVYQSDVAMPLNNLGNLLSDMGRIEDAKDRYEKALEIYEKLLKNDPDNVVYQSDVAMTLNNLGNLLINMGRIEDAKDRYEKALEMRQKLLKTDPDNVVYQSYVGGTLNNLGALLSDMGRIEDAKDRYEKALETYEKLLKNDPDNVVYQSYVGTTLNNLGALLSDMGRIEDAKNRYLESLRIYTEPMQYLTIGKKSYSIIKLIGLNSGQAEEESNLLGKTKFLKAVTKLCKDHRKFFLKYELNHERKLVTEAGLSAYTDLSMINVRSERDSGKRIKHYEKALQAVEKQADIESDETVLNLCSSAACYLRGRKLVNEALVSRKPQLELLRQAVEQFKNAKEAYEKANVCFCIYIGLLKILEEIKEFEEGFEEVDVPKLKKLVQGIVETLSEDANSSIRASFENIPYIFEEKDTVARKDLLIKLDEEIGNIEYKALEKLFGHVNEKINNYFEEPFSPNVIYENWKLKVVFDDPTRVKGKLTIKAGNKILLNRILTPEEVKSHILEINYLDKKYFPQREDEITFTTPGQKKPVIRSVDYFEDIIKDHKTRILQCDCCNDTCIDKDLKIAAVQLKYHVYGKNSVVKITADETYYQKIMKILNSLKDEADIVVFPEFSIPFDLLKRIQKFTDENEIIVVAGSHYVTEEHLGDYGELFIREFGEEDLRKNVSPVVTPFSKIVHNEKLLGAREERELFFTEGMKAGKNNHIFKLQDDLRIGLMICYEYLNSDLRRRLISACDVIFVPQTNPSPERFYETAKAEISNPLCSGNKAYIMVNGIFTIGKDEKVGEDEKVLGGSTGIVSTLDKYSYKRQDEGIIKPVDKAMEQFVLVTSINTDFNSARDTQSGQVPLKTKIIHIFEENEILNNSENEGRRFIQLLETVENCRSKEELKEVLISEENKAIIKAFSPLMHKYIQDLKELTFVEMKKKCCSIRIPQNKPKSL